MAEITTDISNKLNQVKSNRKEDNKITSSIKENPTFSKTKKNNKSFLGLKGKLLKKMQKNQLSINNQERFIINKTIDNNINFNNNSCPICLTEINFEDKHFLHCGHCYHCSCVNNWIKLGNYKCPLCKKHINCDIVLANFKILEKERVVNLADNLEDFNNNNIIDIIDRIRSNICIMKVLFCLLILTIILLFFLIYNKERKYENNTGL